MEKAYKNLAHSSYINKKQDRRHYQKKPSGKDCIIKWASYDNDMDAWVRACNPWFSCKAVLNNITCDLLEVAVTNKSVNPRGNYKLLVSCLDYFASINIIFKYLEGFFR